MKFNADNLEQYKKSSQKTKGYISLMIILRYIPWQDNGFWL